jgi:hypothetical protein
MYIHTYIHTYIRTYIHTYVRTYTRDYQIRKDNNSNTIYKYIDKCINTNSTYIHISI